MGTSRIAICRSSVDLPTPSEMLERHLPMSISITHRYDRSDHSGGHVQGLKKPPTCSSTLFDTIFFGFETHNILFEPKLTSMDGRWMSLLLFLPLAAAWRGLI